MTNVHSTNNQEALSNMLLSPEAKEFIPRHFSDGPGTPDPGAGLLGAGPSGQGMEDGSITTQEPANGLPSYMTTCYPFVAGADPRFGGRGRFRGKLPQQAMFMQHFHALQPGMPRTRFPHPTKGYPSSNAWGNVNDMFQHFGNMPNGMPFDGGTYQNGFLQQASLAQMSSHDAKLSQGDIDSPHQPNGYVKHSKSQKKSNKDAGGNTDSSYSSKTCSKNSTMQTDFPDRIANATLEDLPNTLYNNLGQVAYKDHHKPSGRHKKPVTTSSALNDGNYKKDFGSVALGFNSVSNGTNPAINSNNNGITMVTDHETGCTQSGVLTSKTGLKIKSESSVSMQDSVAMGPSLSDNHPIIPVTLSYASIAQGKGQTSQIKRQTTPVATVTAKTCDNSVSLKKHENNKFVKGSRSGGGRLGNVNVNVADIMEDLERADQSKNDATNKNKAKIRQKGLSAFYDQIEVRHVSKQVKNCEAESKHVGNVSATGNVSGTGNVNVSGTGNVSGTSNVSAMSNTTNQSLYSKIVENVKPVSFSSQGHQSSLVKGQGHHTQSDNNKSDLDFDKKGQSQSDNNNNNQGENGEVKKKRRRRRRRKKKSGDMNEDDDENFVGEEVTLHFEDEEEFPDLSGVSNCDTKSSQAGLNSMSYSDILRNNNTVQSEKSSQEEQSSTYITGASPVKESRTSRKRRKRREVANKAADAEMAEIGLEQHMLELKMKQKLPLAAKKSVSPVRNTTTQGVWKLTPSSSSSTPSSSGKKVSLLLPGTIAPEPVHNSTPHQPSTGAIKQPGILKTSQPVNTTTVTSGGGASSGGGGGKKSKQPITYDLSALIDAAETKKEQPSSKKEAKPIVIKKDDLKPHNILDSSAPTTKRGKERETPKTKKPSPLKKVILKEREEKKRLRMLDEDEVASGFGMMPASAFPNSPISAPVGIGVVSGGESDLSQDASFKGSMDVGIGTPASAELSPISQPSPSCMSPISPGASPMSSGVNSPITGTIQQTVKLKIHSRRFREYCNQVLDKEIDNHVTLLLQDLVRFQDKQYHKDPVKAKSKRRFVLGLREVTKHLKLRKVKCVIISPNLEKIQSKGGLDDALNTILELCNDQKVPFIFALGRRALGRACAKLVPVSVVGVFNYEGSEENFRSLVNLTEKARDAYREMIVQIEKEMAEHPPRASVPGVPHIFAHMGHSRTPSGCSVISFTSSILSEPISENYPHSEPETDNRGYEIEKDNDADDDDDINDGKDPYEADDEGGYKAKQKVTHLYSKSGIKGGEVNDTDYLVDEVNETGDRTVNKVQSELCNKTSDISTNSGRCNTDDVDDCESDDDDDDDYEEEDDDESTESGENSSDEDDIDDESDNQDISEADQNNEREDTVEELPTFIDSVHNFDPFSEILSQHSSKTMENGEDVMSTHSSKTTHSSRTIGDGSGLAADKVGKIMETKNAEKVSSLALKGKPEVDKDLKELRTRSWVKEAQTLHFSDQVEKPKDCDEHGAGDLSNIAKECLDMTA